MSSVSAFFRDLLYIKDILIVLLIPLLLLPLLIAGGGPEAKCAYVVGMMAIFWITEVLPIYVTALLPVFLFPMVGLLSVKEISQQYMNDTNMLFVGGVIVASAIEHWDIHKRIALRVLLLVGAEPRWIMLGLITPTWFLSIWIGNIATTAMMVPIANAILLQLKETDKTFQPGSRYETFELNELETCIETRNSNEMSENQHIDDKMENGTADKQKLNQTADENTNDVICEDDDPAFKRLCKCLTLSIAYAANIGGIGSLTGTVPNLVFKEQLDNVYDKYGIESPVTFTKWLGFGVPTSFVMLLIVWIWLQIFFLWFQGCIGKGDKDRDARVRHVIREQYSQLEPMSFGQGAVMGHFVVLALLWITRDMGGTYGWGYIFKKSYIKDGLPAIFIATLLFIFPSEIPKVFCLRPSGKRTALKPLMSWKAVAEKVPWGVVFLLGGGFAMAYASQKSGLSAWIGDKLSVLDFLEPWLLNLVLCSIVAAMTEVTSNTAACTLMMPILANLVQMMLSWMLQFVPTKVLRLTKAIHIQLNPMYLMFPAAISTSFAFMLPVATPPNAIVFGYGYLRVMDMVLAGFVLNIMCVLVLIGSTETLGNQIFAFHTIPDALLATYNSTN